MNSFNSENMIRKLLIFTIALSVPLIKICAQNPNLDKFSTYKIGFFTKKMNLTAAEAEKFWPVYNDYQKQKNLMQREKIMLIRDFNQNESSLTDKQLREMGDKLISYISEEASMAVSFHGKIREILPPARVIKYYQAENQYKIQLLKELQENRQQRRGIADPDF